MRRIKFRAWDKKLKVMINPDYSDWEDFMIEPDGTVFRSYEYGTYETYRTKEKVDYELMQYTGLKDKNGKDIYEGDILKINGGAKDFMVTVTFEYGCFGVRGKVFQDNHNELKYYTDLDFCSVEVAGNIHENPTLVNK